jgi:hypothetical protein
VSNETDQVTTLSPAADDPVPSTTTPLMQRHLAVMGDLSTKDGEGTASMIHSTGIRYDMGDSSYKEFTSGVRLLRLRSTKMNP